MRSFHRGWFFFLLLLLPFVFTETPGVTAPNFIPLAEIKPGMKGECYTVLQRGEDRIFPCGDCWGGRRERGGPQLYPR